VKFVVIYPRPKDIEGFEKVYQAEHVPRVEMSTRSAAARVGWQLYLMTSVLELALEYHRNLPQRLRDYLHEARGISDAVIDRFLLGWYGSRTTIPIFDRQGDLAFFKLVKDPQGNTDEDARPWRSARRPFDWLARYLK